MRVLLRVKKSAAAWRRRKRREESVGLGGWCSGGVERSWGIDLGLRRASRAARLAVVRRAARVKA